MNITSDRDLKIAAAKLENYIQQQNGTSSGQAFENGEYKSPQHLI